MYARRAVATEFGDVSYIEAGNGPPAVFLHGVFLNADLWHHQLEGLADLRRCLAVDLLAHGGSVYLGAEDLTMSLQADMIVAFLDALDLDTVDLVGNDSGGAVAQLVATRIPGRIRTLTLTNCDTHDNWPPAAFAPIVDLARQGELVAALRALAADPDSARASLSSGFEHPEDLSDEVIAGFFGPIGSSDARAAAIQTYVAGMDNRVTVAIRDDLADFRSPTLIVWGTDDEFFDTSWGEWLATTIPGTVRRVGLEGAKLFFPMERPAAFNQELRDLWTSPEVGAAPTRPDPA
ncbi:MAG: alpha/beta hydrolase [Acidimicrobiales bacterium]|nr:alpha/beta hydrolase [Acidimicrobiales bacterium]